MTHPAPMRPAAALAALLLLAGPAAAELSAPATLPPDLSPLGMVAAADRVVKAVMAGLALASVLTWTIWLVKTVEIAAARRAIARGLRLVASGPALPSGAATGVLGPGTVAGRMVAAAAAEIAASRDAPDGVEGRVALSLERLEAEAARRIARGTGLLATVGSTAPFVGLFGTVWGIMNAFVGIAEAGTSSLAVVAPGIAEALLATAVGLVAAIPAVVFYNGFARAIGAYRAGIGDVAAEIRRTVSRDLARARRQAPEG